MHVLVPLWVKGIRVLGKVCLKADQVHIYSLTNPNSKRSCKEEEEEEEEEECELQDIDLSVNIYLFIYLYEHVGARQTEKEREREREKRERERVCMCMSQCNVWMPLPSFLNKSNHHLFPHPTIPSNESARSKREKSWKSVSGGWGRMAERNWRSPADNDARRFIHISPLPTLENPYQLTNLDASRTANSRNGNCKARKKKKTKKKKQKNKHPTLSGSFVYPNPM